MLSCSSRRERREAAPDPCLPDPKSRPPYPPEFLSVVLLFGLSARASGWKTPRTTLSTRLGTVCSTLRPEGHWEAHGTPAVGLRSERKAWDFFTSVGAPRHAGLAVTGGETSLHSLRQAGIAQVPTRVAYFLKENTLSHLDTRATFIGFKISNTPTLFPGNLVWGKSPPTCPLRRAWVLYFI